MFYVAIMTFSISEGLLQNATGNKSVGLIDFILEFHSNSTLSGRKNVINMLSYLYVSCVTRINKHTHTHTHIHIYICPVLTKCVSNFVTA